MESHFRHDFADVRVHHDSAAAEAAGALAFTSHRDIVFGAGQYNEANLRHELAHVVQYAHASRTTPGVSVPGDAHERDAERMAREGGPPRVAFAPPQVMRKDDPKMPRLAEREKLMDIYNPESAQGSPPVGDAANFKSDMKSRMDVVIDEWMENAKKRQVSTIQLGAPDVQALGTVAWKAIIARFGGKLQKSATSMTDAALQTEIKKRVHLTAALPATEQEKVACNLVVNLMDSKGGHIKDQYNVVADSVSAKTRGCEGKPLPSPLPSDMRDQALFESVRDEIVTLRKTDLIFLTEFGPSYAEGEEAWIQPRLIQHAGETDPETRRRGRWQSLGTILHELMHLSAHQKFRDAFRGVEETDVGIEGFAEYFAREVYDGLRKDAATDPKLRASIEGVTEPWKSSLAPERTNYPQYMAKVEEILKIVGNKQNLSAAYFEGQLEYLGLGNWSAAPNTIGFGAYVTTNEEGYFQLQYGRLVLGNTGRLQLRAGAELSYMTPGDRVGFGPNLMLSYNWPNIYVGGGAGAQVSGEAKNFGQTVRLDVLPRVEIGAKIAFMRVGFNSMLLLPAAAGSGPNVDKKVRGLFGIGVSGEF